MTELDVVLKGKTPVEYIRVSTQKQKKKGGGIQSQKNDIKQFLKDYKITKKPIVFEEAVSGGKDEVKRKQWSAMIAWILDQPDPSKYFVIMRDFTRWSRHTIYGPWAIRVLYDAGVEVVSVNDRASVGTRRRPDANGEFLFGLWTAIGGRERTAVAEKSLSGIQSANLLGKVGGARIDTSLPWKELIEDYLPRLNAPRGSDEYISTTEAARRLRTGGTWIKKRKKTFNELEAWGIANKHPKILEEYLEQMDYVSDTLNKYGQKSDAYAAVSLMTSGFLKDPILYYPFRRTKEDIAEYISNPTPYLSKK